MGGARGDGVLEAACEKALAYSKNPSYKTVKAAAAKIASGKPSDPDEHAFLRGTQRYGKDGD